MSPSVNIELAPPALRRALDLLEQGQYKSLDALLESLILGTSAGNGEADASTASDIVDSSLIRRLPARGSLALAAPVEPVGQLQFLTNRFGPLKLATRVLANLAVQGGSWPAVSDFQHTAADVAQQVGLRLRAEDAEVGRRGTARRWVAYPVGAEEFAARDRFIFSFTVALGSNNIGGPLVQLGCVGKYQAPQVALTEIGWQLAHAPSPTLDGEGDGTLSDDEVQILRQQLRALADEGAAVREFLQAVRRGGGTQGRVDELLSIWHSDWTTDRAAAERAAMLGRLGELRVLRVVGRGPGARIELLDSADLEEEG